MGRAVAATDLPVRAEGLNAEVTDRRGSRPHLRFSHRLQLHANSAYTSPFCVI